MDQLRKALGVGRIDFYGLSYGTVLGSVYRQLFPDHVRSMVLDGAVDANLSLATDATLEAPSIATALEHELTDCPETPGCQLGADPVGAYRDLQQRLARAPLPAPGGGDTSPVTEGDLATATLLYLSVPTLTPGYFQALASADAGTGVRCARSPWASRPTSTGSRSSVHCGPSPATMPSPTRAPAQRPLWPAHWRSATRSAVPKPCRTTSSAVRAGPRPVPSPTSPRTGRRLPLVIGNTYDPNTPYASARRLAPTIGGRLLTYVGYGHTWLLNGSANACMQGVVGRYLVDGALPATGTRCRASRDGPASRHDPGPADQSSGNPARIGRWSVTTPEHRWSRPSPRPPVPNWSADIADRAGRVRAGVGGGRRVGPVPSGRVDRHLLCPDRRGDRRIAGRRVR